MGTFIGSATLLSLGQKWIGVPIEGVPVWQGNGGGGQSRGNIPRGTFQWVPYPTHLVSRFCYWHKINIWYDHFLCTVEYYPKWPDLLFVAEVLKGQSTEKLEKGGTATRLQKHLDRTKSYTYTHTHKHQQWLYHRHVKAYIHMYYRTSYILHKRTHNHYTKWQCRTYAQVVFIMCTWGVDKTLVGWVSLAREIKKKKKNRTVLQCYANWHQWSHGGSSRSEITLPCYENRKSTEWLFAQLLIN